MAHATDIAATVGAPLRQRAGAAVLALAVMMLSAALPAPAAAIEIFGFKLFEKDRADELPVVDPLRYTVSLDLAGGEGGEDLRESLLGASALARNAEKPASGSVGLISQARSDFEQLVAVLYEEGRYGGLVEIRLAGRSLADLPPDADLAAAEPVPVEIRVKPGPQFVFGTVAVVTDKGAAFDAVAYGLVPGEVARSTKVLAAERQIVDALRDIGHPLAEISARDVVADHATRRLDVTLTVAAGPKAPFGETLVDGAEDVDPGFVAYMTGIEPGTLYDPEALEQARKRLRALDVFSSVAVRGRDSLDPDGSVPVDVTVKERKFRYIGLGATYSSTEGGGLEAYWGHRNLFGRAEKLRIEGEVSGIGNTSQYDDLTYRGAILFEKPGVLGPPSKFTARLEVEQENPDAYRRFSVTGAAGFTRDLNDRDTVSAGVEVEYARLTDSFDVERETLTVALPLEFVRDARNDKLNPTAGYRFMAGVTPAYETIGSNAFVKMRGEFSAYRALDEARRFVVAGRVAGGSIVGADLEDVPANRRFYAGGGGSVRGYAYQGIGPRDGAGDPTGGLSMFEASAELRIGITEKISLVPFVDTGLVSARSDWSNAELKTGAGLGLRYQTPFGPLRLDFAVPLDRGPHDPKYGIYAGIGQAF